MMRTQTLKRLLLSLLLALVSAPAQDAQHDFKVRSKENNISPEEVIRGFEAPPVDSYTLGAGDEITIEIWGHPELSGKHVVGPDGKITLSVAGTLNVSGLSREETQAAVAKALTRYYRELSVIVRVDRYTSFRVYILGRVGAPGAVQFESQPTLLDVITRSAALPIGGVGADKAGLGRCAVIRKDKMIWVDLKSLVSQGNLGLNIRLARNDLIYMPDAGDQLVYVLGEGQRPGAFRLTPDMSFLDAFTQAGGANEDAAGDRIELVRSGTGKHRELSIKALLASPSTMNSALEEGDIIFVPKRNMAKFGYVLQKAGPITSFAILGSLLK